MAYGNGFVSLYDLLAPITGVEPPAQYAPDNQTTLPAVQPSGFDMFADRMVGNDRYQQLPDDARRRALAQAIMSIGQSLSQAGAAPSYQGVAQALGSAIPQAYATFEQSLQRGQQQFEHQQDRAYQDEQRQYQKGQQERTLADQKEADKQKEAQLSSIRDTLESRYQNALSMLDQVQNPTQREVMKADLQNYYVMIRKSVNSGILPNERAYEAFNNTFSKIGDAAGHKDALAQQTADDLERAAKLAGYADVQSYVKDMQREHKLELDAKTIGVLNARAAEAERKRQDQARQDLLSGAKQAPEGYVVNPITGVPMPDYSYARPGRQTTGNPQAKKIVSDLLNSRNFTMRLASNEPGQQFEDSDLAKLKALGIIDSIPSDKTLSPQQKANVYMVFSQALSGGGEGPVQQQGSPYTPQQQAYIDKFRKEHPEIKSDDEAYQILMRAANQK